MGFEIHDYLTRAREQEQQDRWTLATTGVCPRCKGMQYHRYDDFVTGEIEIFPCDFCLSEEQQEAILQG